MFWRSVMSAVFLPEVDGDGIDGAQLLQRKLATVAADLHHEELGIQLFRFQGCCTSTVVPGARCVEAPPPESSAKVTWVDALETATGVDVLDPGNERLGRRHPS